MVPECPKSPSSKKAIKAKLLLLLRKKTQASYHVEEDEGFYPTTQGCPITLRLKSSDCNFSGTHIELLESIQRGGGERGRVTLFSPV